MAVYVTGDLHGGFDMAKLEQWDEGEALTRGDYLIVAGDFGFPWDFGPAECGDIRWLEERPYTVLFVDGNHERYDHWASRPVEEWRGGRVQRIADRSPIRRLMRGEVFDLGGARVFTMGGATSVDRDLRIEGVSWWPLELPTEAELDRAREVLDACGWSVDYVVTHTCATRLQARALYPSPAWEHPDRDRLTDFLDELEDRLDYRRWYFGHFHRDREIDDRHTLLYQRIVRLGEAL